MTLQDKLDAFKIDFESGKPPFNVSSENVGLMHRATEELAASDILGSTIKVGDTLPPFELTTASGEPFSSSEALAEGPLVLSYYRGVWCPYCNMELHALEEARGDIEAEGATLVAVSPQTPANSKKSQSQNKLGFPILVDTDNAYARQLGIVFKLPEYLIEVYKTLGATLDTFNGNESWELPMPTRLIIAQDGRVAYADINPDYTRRPDPSELIPVLRELRSQKAA